MFKILLAVILTLVVTASVSQSESPSIIYQTNLEIQCAKTEILFDVLYKDFEELPIFVGSNNSFKIIITANSAKSTWTAVISQGQVSCILGTGSSYKSLLQV